jgi:hypothetical protein
VKAGWVVWVGKEDFADYLACPWRGEKSVGNVRVG